MSLSVRVSRDAKLDLSVLGDESVRNLDQDQKISIANYIFLALAILCKLVTSCLLMMEVLNAIQLSKAESLWFRSLYKTSFVFLLVACSL